MIYRTQKNVPDVYINESRDFQLLGRLLDSVVNDSRFYIEGIKNIISVKTCPSNLLPLLATKIGFFSKYNFQDEQLRGILQAFPWLIRYKGSKRAIYQSIFLFFRLSGINPNFLVDIVNIHDSTSYEEDYTIYITFVSKPLQTNILDAIFEYILPPGYVVKYIYSDQIPTPEDKPVSIEQDIIEGIITGNSIDTQIRGSDFDGEYVKGDSQINDLITGVDTGLTGVQENDDDANPKNINVQE